MWWFNHVPIFTKESIGQLWSEVPNVCKMVSIALTWMLIIPSPLGRICLRLIMPKVRKVKWNKISGSSVHLRRWMAKNLIGSASWKFWSMDVQITKTGRYPISSKPSQVGARKRLWNSPRYIQITIMKSTLVAMITKSKKWTRTLIVTPLSKSQRCFSIVTSNSERHWQ